MKVSCFAIRLAFGFPSSTTGAPSQEMRQTLFGID